MRITPLRWSVVITELIEKAGISRTSIATELGVTFPNVSRFLSGARKPKPATVAKINAIVGRLLSSETLTLYLDAVAEDDGLTEVCESDKVFASDALISFSKVLGATAFSTMMSDLSNLTRDEMQRLKRDLHQVWLNDFVRTLLAKPPKSLHDEIAVVLKRHGLNSDRYYRNLKRIRAREKFEHTLREKLVAANLNPVTRNSIEASVTASCNELLALVQESTLLIVEGAVEASWPHDKTRVLRDLDLWTSADHLYGEALADEIKRLQTRILDDRRRFDELYGAQLKSESELSR